jgi:single-strand DNA-binding protein
MNKYIGIGNLTKNPECRDAGQSKVCSFSLAINEYYYTDGTKKQTTTYIDVETWNKQAENCTKFLSKGSKVAIEGKLKTNAWEKNGQKFSKLFCVADRVHFLGSEESTKSDQPTSKNNQKVEEKVENKEDETDYMDDVPF